MTWEELEKAMQFIVEMNKRSDAKLRRMDIERRIRRVRAERRSEDTEKRLRALLKRVRTRQRISLSSLVKVRRRQRTEVDLRLEALARLVEPQISEGRNGKQ